MSIANPIDNRREFRDPRFSGEYTMRIRPVNDEGRIIPVRPVDVSRRGLGFFVKERLKAGEYFYLEIGKDKFRVEIAYCHPHMGIDNLFRCGLFLRDAEGDLSVSSKSAGLLSDRNSPKNGLE